MAKDNQYAAADKEAHDRNPVPRWLRIKPIKSMTPEEKEKAFKSLGGPICTTGKGQERLRKEGRSG